MLQTDSLQVMYSELQASSTERARFYSTRGIIDWATFASSPHAHKYGGMGSGIDKIFFMKVLGPCEYHLISISALYA